MAATLGGHSGNVLPEFGSSGDGRLLRNGKVLLTIDGTMNTSLLARTVELLNASELSTREIADGARVGFEWLRKLRAGAPHDFGVSRVQAVHDFLAARAAQQDAPQAPEAAA